MQLLVQMTGHSALRYTATLVVARYADWIHAHPSFIESLLKFTVGGLNDKEVHDTSRNDASQVVLSAVNVCVCVYRLCRRLLLRSSTFVTRVVRIWPRAISTTASTCIT
jgi:hypothetical protein